MYMPGTSRLGALIKEASNKKAEREGIKRYSLRKLAKDAGTVQPYLTRVIRGEATPSRKMLLRICKALGCSQEEAADIFAETEYREPSSEELETEILESSHQDRCTAVA
jgi:transcriptional regulator with XRE-family HTH domain